ncbi:MAG: RNA-directed polymerase [Euryarchaeota archaeon]|nr:RNA-directed polymerase [Euryarchaeota archaeon]
MNRRIQTNTETKLLQISKVSKDKPDYRFVSLASLLTEDYLTECYRELKKNKASGIDGVSVKQYGEGLEENLRNLVGRMKTMSYRPQNVLRVYIPKAQGGKRPLGIPAVEDKIVQRGISEILKAVFEPNFIEESYGFREGKGCHDALKKVGQEITSKPINYVLDADIKGFFDNVNHEWMVKFLEHRINDKNLIRLIVRFLKSGVMEDGKYMKTEQGTPQGGIISPVLANIYLHYVLDLWFKKVLRTHLRGYAEIVRYADDFLILVQYKEDCDKILESLRERLAKFSLELSEAKTSIVRFGRTAGKIDKDNKPGTFDFLGFTHYCGKSRKGYFKVGRKTSKTRFSRRIKEMNEFLRINRNKYKLSELWFKLRQKLLGHYRYYGVSENSRSIQRYSYNVRRLIFKWLNRRCQKKSFNWQGFNLYLEKYPLPKPKIYVSFYTA